MDGLGYVVPIWRATPLSRSAAFVKGAGSGPARRKRSRSRSITVIPLPWQRRRFGAYLVHLEAALDGLGKTLERLSSYRRRGYAITQARYARPRARRGDGDSQEGARHQDCQRVQIIFSTSAPSRIR